MLIFTVTSISLVFEIHGNNLAFADSVVTTIPVGTSPARIGINPMTNMIYVSNSGGNTISAIDGATNAVIATIQVGSEPEGVSVNPDTNKIYVTNYNDNTVSVINGSTNTVTKTIIVKTSYPENVVVNTNTNKVYVGGLDGTVSVIDGSTDTLTTSYGTGSCGGAIYDLGFNPVTNKGYATCIASGWRGIPNQGYVLIIDGSTDMNSGEIFLGNNTVATGLGINTHTNTLYVHDGNHIDVIDGNTNNVSGTVPIVNDIVKMTANPNYDIVYATNFYDKTITKINGATNNVVGTMTVGASPLGIAINPNTNKIYVANSGDNTVSVIDSSPAPSITLSAFFKTYLWGDINIVGNVQNPIPGVNQTQLLVYAPNGNLVLNNTEPTAFQTGYAISRSEGKGNYTVILTYNNISTKTSFESWINNDPVFGFVDPSEASDGSVSISSLVGYTLAGEPISVAINDSSNSTLATFTAPLLGKGQFNFEINSTTAKQIFTKSGNYTIVLTHIPTGVQRSAVLAYTASTIAPSAPQNLQSTAGNSQVALSWSIPQNNGGSSITNYDVYRGTSSGSETLLAQAGNDTSYTDGTVTNGQTYFYTVTAVNYVGESAPSNEVSATPIGPPQPPTGLTATGALLKINLNWNAPSNDGGSPITGYMIEKSTDNGNTWSTLVANTGSTGTTYSDSNVLPLVTYMYRVSAINDMGSSSPSNIASATTTSSSTNGITLNNVQSTYGAVSSSNQITLGNFDSGSGNNKLLVVGISADNSDVNSITFNGISMTRKAGSFYNNDAEFWYLKNPSGTGDIVVTMNGQTSAVVGAYSFSGVNQTTPLPTSTTKHNTTPNSPNITITTKFANDWVLDLPSIYGGSTLGSPTCAQQWDANVPDSITGASSSKIVPTPSAVTCKWTASSGDLWDDAAIEIKASK